MGNVLVALAFMSPSCILMPCLRERLEEVEGAIRRAVRRGHFVGHPAGYGGSGVLGKKK